MMVLLPWLGEVLYENWFLAIAYMMVLCYRGQVRKMGEMEMTDVRPS
jgi:hypothetical protein